MTTHLVNMRWKSEKKMDTFKRIKILIGGAVDEGKSTLLGRLLYDTKQLKEDQIKQCITPDGIDFSLCNDGLKDEQLQKITIDLANKYIHTNNGILHLLDCPGHAAFIDRFCSAASQADAAILVYDLSKPDQLDRLDHLLIILKSYQLTQVIICLTKSDLVSIKTVKQIKASLFKYLTQKFENYFDFNCIEISATAGINIDGHENALWHYMQKIKVTTKIQSFLKVQFSQFDGQDWLYMGYSTGQIDCSSQMYAIGVNRDPHELKLNFSQLSRGEPFAFKSSIENIQLLVSKQPIYIKEIKATVVWFNFALLPDLILTFHFEGMKVDAKVKHSNWIFRSNVFDIASILIENCNTHLVEEVVLNAPFVVTSKGKIIGAGNCNE